jgi:hypothetical protein
MIDPHAARSSVEFAARVKRYSPCTDLYGTIDSDRHGQPPEAGAAA